MLKLKVSFRVLGDCCKDGVKLAGFVEQVGHFGGGNTAAVHQEFEPILGFLDFLEAIADFGNEFGFRPAARRLSIVGANRRAGTKHLLAENLGDSVIFR